VLAKSVNTYIRSDRLHMLWMAVLRLQEATRPPLNRHFAAYLLLIFNENINTVPLGSLLVFQIIVPGFTLPTITYVAISMEL